jgi:predicted nucleic acid-binding protein
LIVVDTSAAVAAFASWHEKHQAVCSVLPSDARLVAHCALETYSVLTRLPAPHRAPGQVVADFLAARFADVVRMSLREYRRFVAQLPAHGIAGGAAYDALVAATAAHNDATLLTCDRRATRIYEIYRVDVRLV